ncbi:Protein OBERON 4 [Striga hermonthica]|uniref:Protein OBERON 4 n=1 Tax=Striga hermonthica TaxID=68872 RepID=A0A9N7MEU5_STRHE|nr:Protein OBERON 4 [Striga hermonthica]
MKRLKSSEDLHSYQEKKDAVKDWGRKEEPGLQRASSSLQRSSSYYRSSESGRKVLSSSSLRYDRPEEVKESLKMARKRPDYDLESYERRKHYDRFRDGSGRGVLSPSPKATYCMDQTYRSESFSGPRRDFPKGFRSERDRPKGDSIATSWRRFGGGKESDDGSRSGTESSRGSRMESKEVGKSRSPQGVTDVKSPAWSKDSGSELSKSVEGRKCDNMPVESGGPGSDREEGELEPDPQPHAALAEPAAEDRAAVCESLPQKKADDELPLEDSVLQERERFLSVDKGDARDGGSWDGQAECEITKDVEDDVGKNNDFVGCQATSFEKGGECGDENDMNDDTGGENNVVEARMGGSLEEDADSTCGDKLLLQEQEEERGVDVEMEVRETVVAENVEITAGSEHPFNEKMSPILKDKGKGVALLPSDCLPLAETKSEAENKVWGLEKNGDVEIEGPSARGFQFFSADPVKKPEEVQHTTSNKPKDDKLALELSLSLPNVLLPIGAQSRGQAPGSPSHGRSMNSFASSFRTNSDGFTASMSFSGSQHFTHNPSCSLTHNAPDFEQSVKSKPLFQGVDWKALAEENKNEEATAHQEMASRENVFVHRSQSTEGKSGGQALAQTTRVTGSSSKLPVALERQLSFNKHLSGAQSFGSYENGLNHCTERRQLMTEKDTDSLQRQKGSNEKDHSIMIGSDFAESIVFMTVSEPLPIMCRRFSDMSGKQIASIKEFVLDIICNPAKQWQLNALQKALQKRSDVTLDMLVNAHSTQLEILVALKTGLREFLLQKNDIPTSDLAEIFLNMRCRNLNCKSVLPVDECDCKICSRMSDFCRECMCLVCSKFDMASNTCSWVGCDVCLHWCHADCGLQESHIRNGKSAVGSQSSMEMQFYCVACGHPSEMFGFVKEVFQNFVKDWTTENLSRELEYVRRIFCASEDMRGKQLHDTATKMLSKLANRSDLQDIQNCIMNFFNESNHDSIPSIEPRKEVPSRNHEASDGIGIGAGWLKPVYPDKSPHFGLDVYKNDKYATRRNLTM